MCVYIYIYIYIYIYVNPELSPVSQIPPLLNRELAGCGQMGVHTNGRNQFKDKFRSS